MYCPHCMKKIPRTATTCPFCSQKTHTPTAGMATLRVSCRPHPPVWMMVVFPITYILGYKVHISVDNQNYVLKCKKKQIDIPISIGTHQIRIAALSKKSAKAIKVLGVATSFIGAALGSGSTVYLGSSVEDLGEAFSDKGIAINFESNELLTIPVKLAWNCVIVEDEKG